MNLHGLAPVIPRLWPLDCGLWSLPGVRAMRNQRQSIAGFRLPISGCASDWLHTPCTIQGAYSQAASYLMLKAGSTLVRTEHVATAAALVPLPAQDSGHNRAGISCTLIKRDHTQPSPMQSSSPCSLEACAGTPGSDSSALYSYSLPALAPGWLRPREGSPGGRPSASRARDAALSERPPTCRDSERMCTRLRPVACMCRLVEGRVGVWPASCPCRAEVLWLVRLTRPWACGCGCWQGLQAAGGGMG